MGDLYNAMDVYEDGEYWWTERLEYMSSDGKCGVFTVMVPLGKNRTRKSYDIRLKNSAVESDPDEQCRNKFDSLRRGLKVTTLYSSNYKKKSFGKQRNDISCGVMDVRIGERRPVCFTVQRFSLVIVRVEWTALNSFLDVRLFLFVSCRLAERFAAAVPE
ncbi:hypothetical protein MRX96_052533 [Rhipicephalus microplus]